MNNEVTPEEIERVLRLFPPNELPHVLARALKAEREKMANVCAVLTERIHERNEARRRAEAAERERDDLAKKYVDMSAAEGAREKERNEARRLIAEVRDHLTYPSNDPYRVKLDEFFEKLEGK